MPDYAEQRFNMVVSQVLASGVTDERILAALGKIERERFVPTARRAVAYAEAPVEVVAGRYLMDVRNFALMLDAAGIRREDKVLDVGCATGVAAVLAQLAARVVAWSRMPISYGSPAKPVLAQRVDTAGVVRDP